MKILKVMEHMRAEQKASTKPLVRYNPELDKYENTVMCPDKVAKGREMLAKAGLPPELQNRQTKK
ncbi:MAG TPA: hypothetical protein VN038_24400 [Dyadobacter sp.]|nr:hypothetical protein [Dyadobacter sp.]